MTFQYSDIVDKIYGLSLEDKVRLKSLLENNIADSRRSEIVSNYKNSREELNDDKLHFSSDVKDLKNMM